LRGGHRHVDDAGPDGAPLAGTASADRTSWTLGQNLAFGAAYTVTGTATGTDGRQAPVIVNFGVEPADKAAVATRVTLTSTRAVEGAWAWIKHDDGRRGWTTGPRNTGRPAPGSTSPPSCTGSNWRPARTAPRTSPATFTIGRNQVVLADANSHNLVVQQNDVTVATYDASYGSGDDIGDPNRVTRSGIRIVMGKEENTLMSNPADGYSNVPEKWAVRISDIGEFIHQNQYA